MNKLKKNDNSKIIRAFIDSKNNDIDSLSFEFNISRSRISEIIDEHFSILKKIMVVSSLDIENTYFVFNGINERKFTVDFLGFINESYLFNTYEKKELKQLGFNI